MSAVASGGKRLGATFERGKRPTESDTDSLLFAFGGELFEGREEKVRQNPEIIKLLENFK
jgi:hypothetical protein